MFGRQYVVETVDSKVIPYLIHFGEKGIAPRVFSVDGNSVKYRQQPGISLYRLLQECQDEGRIVRMMKELGRNVGYTAKYNVVHGNLLVTNVIIDRPPVITGWQNSHINEIGEPVLERKTMQMLGLTSATLLSEVRDALTEVGRDRYFKMFLEPYLANFALQLREDLKPTHEEIQRGAQRYIKG